MKKLFMVLSVLSIFVLNFNGCEKSPTESESTDTTTTDPASSKAKSDQAYALLEGEFDKVLNGSFETATDYDQLKFQSANTLYKEALDLDAANTDASFGAAITEILSAYYDSDINAVVKEFEASANDGSLSKLMKKSIIPSSTDQMNIPVSVIAENIFAMHKIALKNPPLISRVQEVISSKFMPKVENAINYLSQLEGNQNFKFVISGKMQGDIRLKSLSIYPTEVYFVNAALNGVKAALSVFLMYNFKLSEYTVSAGASALAQDNTEFFVLKSDGASRAATAKNSLLLAINKIKSGIDALKNISGNKSDAILKLKSNGGTIMSNDLDSVKKYLDKIQSAFSQDYSVKLYNSDSEGNDYTIKVNLGNFFNNPAQNPKAAYLPAYTVTTNGKDIVFKFNASTYNEFTFPDPTFSGLLPGMSNETLKRLLQIDLDFAYRLSGSAWYCNGYYYNWEERYLNGKTVKIITTSGKTYTAKTEDYGYFTFIIRDASTTPEDIAHYYINLDGTDVEFISVNTSVAAFQIKAKSSDYAFFNIPNTPTDLTAAKSGYVVSLNWKVTNSGSGNGYFKVQRKTGTGEYVDLVNSYFYSYNYEDNSVSKGKTYTYRIQPVPSGYLLYNNNEFFPKEAKYSNTVTVSF